MIITAILIIGTSFGNLSPWFLLLMPLTFIMDILIARMI